MSIMKEEIPEISELLSQLLIAGAIASVCVLQQSSLPQAGGCEWLNNHIMGQKSSLSKHVFMEPKSPPCVQDRL